MKRLFAILTLSAYVVASLGVSFDYFYCCGKLKAISLSISTKEKECQKKSDKGCCDNKTVTVKVKTDQQSNDFSSFNFDAALSPAILHTNNCSVLDIASNSNAYPLYKRPPPDLLPSRQVLYCVFRI